MSNRFFSPKCALYKTLLELLRDKVSIAYTFIRVFKSTCAK